MMRKITQRLPLTSFKPCIPIDCLTPQEAQHLELMQQPICFSHSCLFSDYLQCWGSLAATVSLFQITLFLLSRFHWSVTSSVHPQAQLNSSPLTSNHTSWEPALPLPPPLSGRFPSLRHLCFITISSFHSLIFVSSPLLWIWSFSSTAHLVSYKGHLTDLLATLHPSNNQNSARIFLLIDHATFFFFFALSPFFFISKIIDTCTSLHSKHVFIIIWLQHLQSRDPIVFHL